VSIRRQPEVLFIQIEDQEEITMTSNYTQWDPFSELRRTMDNLFDQGFSRPWRLMPGVELKADTAMPVDIWETDDALVVKAAIPGVEPGNVDIRVTNDILTIKAEVPHQDPEGQMQFHRREITNNGFSRAFTLPSPVDSDRAEARYEHGMLYLTLPKAEVARPKQIRISGTNGHFLN
jgi:HSP20 family protein